MITAVHLPVK